MNSIYFDYNYDIKNIVNLHLILTPFIDYRKKGHNLYHLLDTDKAFYCDKDFGNILYENKKETIYPLINKYNYLASLYIFYKNNNPLVTNISQIDMHGLYTFEMTAILDVLYILWLEKNIKKVCIITGRGDLILYNKLRKYLIDWNMKFVEQHNSIIIKL